MNELATVCQQHAMILEAIVKRVESQPDLEYNPEIQAEMRKEVEYAAYIITEFSGELNKLLEGSTD